MKRLIKNIILLLAIAAISVAAYWQLEKNKNTIEADAKLSQQRNESIPVITDNVSMEKLDGDFTVTGSFAPNKQVAIMSESAGKAIRVNFENGTFVKAGQNLVSIDNDLLKIQLSTVKTNLEKAENDHEKLNNLLGEGGVTLQQVEDAELAIDNLQAQVKSISKQIEMTYVKAPISGIISKKKIEKGSLVAPAMPIATITDISRLKMQIHLTEEQVIKMEKGNKVNLSADILKDKMLTGKVSFVDVSAGIGKRYLVEIEIPNPKNKLKAGMTGTVYFDEEETKEVLSVPRAAIVGDLQNAKVYVIENGTAILKEINVGHVFGNKIVIKSGVEIGEKIVVSGQINLEDGMRVSLNEN